MLKVNAIGVYYAQLNQLCFQIIAFASTAGGLRTYDGALFASLEKYATAFFQFRLRRNRTK